VIRKRLWAPWRLAYIAGARKGKKSKKLKCLFCEKGKSKPGARNLVVVRGRHGFCMLNLFPYNNGHMLVAPYRHVANLEDLTQEEWLDLWRLTGEAIRRLRKVLSPDGFNTGINLGRAAGAGIPRHLHLHVVPRWMGDTNFMPLLTDTRVISQSLASAHKLLTRA